MNLLPKYFNDLQQQYVSALFDKISDYYQMRLQSLVVFGSYARAEARYNSDLDLLIVLRDDEPGDIRTNFALQGEFVKNIEMPLDYLANQMFNSGVRMELSSLILRKSSAVKFNPLYLDMTEHCCIIFDRELFFYEHLLNVKKKMLEWGSKKTMRGAHWEWHIKPNLKFGEIIDYDE